MVEISYLGPTFIDLGVVASLRGVTSGVLWASTGRASTATVPFRAEFPDLRPDLVPSGVDSVIPRASNC